MEDKWLDEIRESLSDFEMDTPEGLWESLGVEKPVSKISWRRLLMIAAAVISILMIGSGIIFLVTQTKPIEINDIKYAMTTGMPDATPHESNSNVNRVITSPSNKTTVHKTTVTYASNEQTIVALLDSIKTDLPTPDDPTHNTANETKEEKELGLDGEKNSYVNIYPKNINRKNGYSDKLALNISASGIGNVSKGRSFWLPGQNGNDIFLGSSLPTSEIRHHTPIRIGLTMQYNISKKLAIESGLIYSVIGSDISVSQDKYQSTATRRMQYVGIPVNVKFSAWSWKFINAYLSAGVAGEKCISNRFEVKSMSDALPLDNFAKQTEKPFQWSANAAAGIQLSPIPNIGIFAEPGISYYFNDGSSIQTIYKDHPCNFNLNLGIRLTLNP